MKTYNIIMLIVFFVGSCLLAYNLGLRKGLKDSREITDLWNKEYKGKHALSVDDAMIVWVNGYVNGVSNGVHTRGDVEYKIQFRNDSTSARRRLQF